MRWLQTFFLSFTLVLAALPLLAEEDADVSEDAAKTSTESVRSVSMDEIVVSATGRASSWKDAPVMVTVIDREELKNAPEETLDGFLRRVPAVSTKRTHVAECGPGREITLRGVPEQKRTLVLVNGIPANDDFGGSVNWSVIPLEAVERIEIVRGPMSALYGSRALGGVINIITSMPNDRNETEIRASYGSLDTYAGSIIQGGMFERHGYLATGRMFDTDGYQKVEDPQPYHEKNARNEWAVRGDYFHAPGPKSLLTVGIYSTEENYSRGRETDQQVNSKSGANVSFEHGSTDGVQITASLYGHYLTRDVHLGAPPLYAAHDHTESDVVYRVGELFKASSPVGRYNIITAGINASWAGFDKNNEYEPQTIESEDGTQSTVTRDAEANGSQYLISLFAQDEITVTSGLHRFLFTVGGRADYFKSFDGSMFESNPATETLIDEDYDETVWTALNPKAGFVYRYDRWTTLRLSAGRAFAAPTLSELFMVFSRGPIVVNGNPDLEPETAWSFALGIDQWIIPSLLLRAEGYYTLGDDFIGTRLIDTNTYRYDNITRVEIWGIDAVLEYEVLDWLSFHGGYTYNRSTMLEDDTAPETEGNDLPFVPVHKGHFGVTYDDPRILTIDVSVTYIGPRYTDIANTNAGQLDEYVSLDATIARAIGRHVRLAVSGENLLDEEYDVYSIPNEVSYAPGMLLKGEVTFSF